MLAVIVPPKKKDDKSLQNQNIPKISSRGLKETENAAQLEENKIMAEITTTAEAMDRQALEVVKQSLAEAKSAEPEPDLAPSLEDEGVVVPSRAAEEVISKGTTIELPLSEGTYQKGLRTGISGKVINGVVVGVSSLAAMVIYVGRLIKLAHKHTMKILWRGV